MLSRHAHGHCETPRDGAGWCKLWKLLKRHLLPIRWFRYLSVDTLFTFPVLPFARSSRNHNKQKKARSKLDSWLSMLFSVWGSETLLCAIIIFNIHSSWRRRRRQRRFSSNKPSCRWIPAWQNNRPRPKCRNLPSIVPWIPLIQRLTTMCRRTWGIPWAFSEFFWWSKVKGTSELMNSCRTSAINWWPKGWWIMCFLDISAAYFAMGRLAPERPPPSWERLATWWDVVGSTKCWVHLVSKPLAWGRLRFFSSAESTYGNFQQISHCHQPGKLHLSLDSSLLLHSKIQMCYPLLPSSLAEELETIWVSRVIKNDLQLTFSITVPYVFTTNLFSMMCSEVEPVSEQGLLLRLMNDLFTETLCWR